MNQTIYDMLIDILGPWITDYPYILGTASIVIIVLCFTMLYNVFYSLEWLVRGGDKK